MGIISSNKQISTEAIGCGDGLQVTLALTAAPDIVSNPADIVLVLDRSGSMQGSPLSNLKIGAKKFVDIIDEATDDSGDGQIGNGSHIGIVSFAAAAVQETGLITSVEELKDAIDGLSAQGNTNHADAFEKAVDLFDPNSQAQKVIVMFTDGVTTEGLPPEPVAQAAKEQGIVIYCIGLIGDSGLDVDQLNDWATPPPATHVSITPDAAELERLFDDLAANITKPGARDVVIDEMLTEQFQIVSIDTPSRGRAEQQDDRSLRWQIDSLGISSSETAILTFTIRHTGNTSGNLHVNQSITYSDQDGNVVNFPNPTVEVNCITPIIETCTVSTEIIMDGCSDVVVFNAGEIGLSAVGRVLEMSATITDVCPGKRVAMAVALYELDAAGAEYPRGMKTMTIPAHSAPECQDILIECIKFVLPEDLNVSAGAGRMCSSRRFRATILANYIDTGVICCGLV